MKQAQARWLLWEKEIKHLYAWYSAGHNKLYPEWVYQYKHYFVFPVAITYIHILELQMKQYNPDHTDTQSLFFFQGMTVI